MKRILSVCLALLMSITFINFYPGADTASAADGTKEAVVNDFSQMEAAMKDETVTSIKLGADITAYTEANVPHIFDVSNKVIDLQGYTLSSANYSLVFKGSNFTIRNGKTVALNGGSYSVFLGRTDDVNTNVNLENLTCTGGINVHNTTVTVKNVVASGTNYYALWSEGKSDVIVESGSFASAGLKGNAVVGVENTGAAMHINGGTFTVKDGQPLVISGKDLLEPVISGGVFNTDVSQYITENKIIEKNKEGNFLVRAITEEDYVVHIGVKGYLTFREAAENAKDGDVITLSKDVALDVKSDIAGYEIRFNKDVNKLTIEGAGHKLVFAGSPVGYSWPNNGANSSAGFNFIGNDLNNTLPTGKTLIFNNVNFVNYKDGSLAETSGIRHSWYPYALAEKSEFNNCSFENGLVVYGNVDFNNCRFDVDRSNMYSLFVDHQYDGQSNTTVNLNNCAINAEKTAYGDLKVASNGKCTVNINMKDCTLDNKTTEKGGVYINNNTVLTISGDKGVYKSDTTPVVEWKKEMDITSGKIVISGGNFNNLPNVRGSYSGGTVEIIGGTFGVDPSSMIDERAYGTKNEGGTFKVLPYADKLSMNQKAIALTTGGTVNLVATPVGDALINGDLTWKSSDEKVAVVDSKGVVTAKGKGTAEIRVTAANGAFVAALLTVTNAVVEEAVAPVVIGPTPEPVKEIKVGMTSANAEKATATVGETLASAINKIAQNSDSIVGIDTKTAEALKEAMDEGKNIKTEIVAEPITLNEMKSDPQVAAKVDEIKNAIEEIATKVSTASESKYEIKQLLNLEVAIKVDNDEEKIGNITQLEEPVTFTIALPEGDIGEDKAYYIIRTHLNEDGTLENTLINTEVDLESKTLTFETDRFSTFGVLVGNKPANMATPISNEDLADIVADENFAVSIPDIAELPTDEGTAPTYGETPDKDNVGVANPVSGNTRGVRNSVNTGDSTNTAEIIFLITLLAASVLGMAAIRRKVEK